MIDLTRRTRYYRCTDQTHEELPMKISAQLTVIIAVIFAVICFSVAITGFSAVSEITDPARAADARGFAGFWAFLGFIAVIFGALGVWMVRTHKDGDEG
jgi:uncharacterized Tic20 family protein